MSDEKNLEKALSYMQEARKVLFQKMHTAGSPSKELLRGVDKLGQALEFAENPKIPFFMCPDCGSLSFENVGRTALRCRGCKKEWTIEKTNQIPGVGDETVD